MLPRSRWTRLLLAASAALCSYGAAWAETRLGLVVGNAAYPDAALKTAVNDAALMAETLRQLGFDVTEGRDLDQTTLRRLIRDFAARIEASEGEVVVYVYLAGHGAQAGAKNYFLPTDARIARIGDVEAEALSVDRLVQDLQNQKVKARFVVLDAATNFPAADVAKLAPGLAAITTAPEALIAQSAAAGEIMPPQTGDYGVYAVALTQAMREPGVPADIQFGRATLRVHQETKGAVSPVYVSTLSQPFLFLERAADAAPAPVKQVQDIRDKALRDLDPATAYARVIERNTIRDYQEFLTVFPNDPLARKVKARLAKLREARAWQQAARRNTRESYWTYRRLYPRGQHVTEAEYELAQLGAASAPPADFVIERWDEFEPPPPDEIAYYDEIIERPVIYREIVPPPPPPVYYSDLFDRPPPPPPPSSGPGMLPLIGLGALGAAAIIPQIVRRPAPRPAASPVPPPRPPAPPVVVNPPPVPGARPIGPGQIVPQPGQPPVAQPGGAIQPPRPPLPGQIPAVGNRPVQPMPGAGAPTSPAPSAVVPSVPGAAARPPIPGTSPNAAVQPGGGAGGPGVIDRRGRRWQREGAPVPPVAPGGTAATPPTVANPVNPPPQGPRVLRPPATPGAVVRELPRERRERPGFLQQTPPQPRALPPSAGPRPFAPPPHPMMRPPPPRPVPPPVAAPVQRPAPPPVAAPIQRPAPPPITRPMPPPPQPQGRPGRPPCPPNDPRPQCR